MTQNQEQIMTSRTGYTNPLSHNDAAVLKYMEMYQNIIARMARNSSACKHWCIVLISGFLAFVFKNNQPEIALLGGIPILIFCFLDSYYFGLGNKFRIASNESAKKIRESRFFLADLFVIKADGRLPVQL